MAFRFATKTYPHICIICGKEFTSKSSRTLTCSDECRKEHNRRKERGRPRKSTAKFKRPGDAGFHKWAIGKTVVSTKEVVEINKEAREHDMTYGQYVAWKEAQERTVNESLEELRMP